MRVEEKWSYGKPRTMSIADAVERDLIDNEGGAVESAERTARNTALMLGKVIQTLTESGVLPENKVLALLPGYKNAEED